MGADQCDQDIRGGWSGPKGGDIQIAPPTQHVVEQSAVMVHQETGDVIAQFTVNLPARGRTILGQKAIDIFQRVVPHFVGKSLVYSAFCKDSLQQHVFSVEDQHWVRSQLSLKGLVAFVPNGAILPRASGADDRPIEDSKVQHVVRFESPTSMNVSFELPNSKTTICGMGIKKGVNLIVGGGFHGKSTLLSAIQLGVYDKIPGDGREFCVCDESSVKIRAEDGRSVTNVDISSFISNLPFGKSTNNFTTLDASGSTSQASNIIEVR
jgi:predicted ABC-class ATPase